VILVAGFAIPLMVTGALMQAVGLGLDAWLHLHNHQLVHQEALFTFSNPGHALIIVGIGVALLGVVLQLMGRQLDRVESPLVRLGIPLWVVVSLVGVAVLAGRSGLGKPDGPVAVSTISHVHAATPAAPSNGQTQADLHAHADALTDGLPLDQATEAALERQLAVVRSVALRYPHLSDALKSGYTQALEYGPGIGAHYMRFAQTFKPFDVANPAMLLYDGDSPGSVVVGVMYYVYDSSGPPDGFAGPLDHWHQHPQTCVGPTGAHFSGDPEGFRECGHAGRNGWMLHVWCVPGWESALGVFSEENNKLL
jgi:hypothetical protein